ncbi:hypothetical protein EXIGLDRAFT_391466 [Exidia glandulosa HHB12029]|uniref:Uncharacterized protein n=1 Tax=Exidia glandulosa HHB12029 TaxID=1314781 RepID=A0A165BS23_EXIGL|nr:hypothetical protein EXIGLDRAFT_391466 [Exidia glandulosa HHB12029]
MMMSSSRDSSIEFHVTGSGELAGLPLQTLDVQPQITLARERDGLAFLTPPVPTRWDGIDPSLRIELGAWLSAQCQTRPELEGRVIVTDVVRSSGYVGGLILSRHTEVSANLSLGSAITASAGGSVGHRRSLNAMLRGPDDWAPNMSAEYAIILRYTTAVTRPGFLQRVRLKLGLSRSSPSSSSPPLSQAHRISANATNATNQRLGSQGNLQTGAPGSSAQLAMEDSQGRRGDSVSPPAFDIHDICDPSPLTPFLDMVLERHEEVDIAIGDLNVLGDFMAVLMVIVCPRGYQCSQFFTATQRRATTGSISCSTCRQRLL